MICLISFINIELKRGSP